MRPKSEKYGHRTSNIQTCRTAIGHRGNGSISHITAIFGFMLAGLVMQDAAG